MDKSVRLPMLYVISKQFWLSIWCNLFLNNFIKITYLKFYFSKKIIDGKVISEEAFYHIIDFVGLYVYMHQFWMCSSVFIVSVRSWYTVNRYTCLTEWLMILLFLCCVFFFISLVHHLSNIHLQFVNFGVTCFASFSWRCCMPSAYVWVSLSTLCGCKNLSFI